MTKIKDFDTLSDTAQWLISEMAGLVPDELWSAGGPDFEISGSGHAIDTNEFFVWVADAIDKEVERQANKIAARKLDDLFRDMTDDIYSIQMEFRDRIVEKLGVEYGQIFGER